MTLLVSSCSGVALRACSVQKRTNADLELGRIRVTRHRCQFQGCDIEELFDEKSFCDHLRNHGTLEDLLDREVDYCKYQRV